VFSAIGPSVNEAARIEKLTKTINVPMSGIRIHRPK
jgi:class 3 adenylate cyclase